jgi:hypothetical protein
MKADEAALRARKELLDKQKQEIDQQLSCLSMIKEVTHYPHWSVDEYLCCYADKLALKDCNLTCYKADKKWSVTFCIVGTGYSVAGKAYTVREAWDTLIKQLSNPWRVWLEAQLEPQLTGGGELLVERTIEVVPENKEYVDSLSETGHKRWKIQQDIAGRTCLILSFTGESAATYCTLINWGEPNQHWASFISIENKMHQWYAYGDTPLEAWNNVYNQLPKPWRAWVDAHKEDRVTLPPTVGWRKDD